MRTSLPIVLGCLLAQAALAGEEAQIFVRVQDYASISPQHRTEAFTLASQILARAGVAAVWLDCSHNQAGPVDERCKRSPNSQDVILRLMPDKMAAATGLKTSCLGFAILPRNDLGRLAAVFVDKARRKAERALASRSAVLGHAVAHEVAHLLIGKAEHSPRGLMQAVWSRSELLRATASTMELTRAEARAIQANLAVRLSRIRTPTRAAEYAELR